MNQNTLGGLLVILFICIIAFGCGALFGMAHVGEEFSKEIIPTSLTRSSDVVQVIDEGSFEPENITVKFQTQTKVKPVNKTTNNTINKTNITLDNKTETNTTNYNYEEPVKESTNLSLNHTD